MNGICIDGQIIEPLCTLLPVQSIVDKLKTHGWCIEKSDDAGRFLCEFIFATSLITVGKHVPVLFVHVPPVGEPYSQEELDKVLLEVVRRCIKEI